MKGCLNKLLVAALVLVLLGVGWRLLITGNKDDDAGDSDRQRPVPVEVGQVSRGKIQEQRVFSGSLEASASITIASKISGRVLRVHGEISDPVNRGQILVELEPDEMTEAVARAKAELAVSNAQLKEAQNRKEVAGRELERVRQLSEKGISSDSALDAAESEYLIRSSTADVAKANLTTRESALKTAELNLQETQIRARWSEGDNQRIIASRQVEEGETISSQDRLFTVVEIQPIRAVIYVPERDYGRINTGQSVEISTDAWPGKRFTGRIHRIAPVFREDSRQARVEILAENNDTSLKPGMFIRAEVTLAEVDDAILVPAEAVTRRGESMGVFTVDPEKNIAHWQPVKIGLQNKNMVQILEPEVSGRVVTLGQQLIDEGSILLLPGSPE